MIDLSNLQRGEMADKKISLLQFTDIIPIIDQNKKYFEYAVKVRTPQEEYCCYVRYSIVLKFHEYVKKTYKHLKLPPFPPKTAQKPTEKDCLKRREMFQKYFEYILTQEDVCRDAEFLRLFQKPDRQ